MKLKNILTKVIAIVAITLVFQSCDDDFNSVGNEVIGEVNFQESEYSSQPAAYSRSFEKVQTSNLPGNLLGVYNDPFYGSSDYSVISQILPTSFNPDFGDNAILKSVVISIPYYSEVVNNEDPQGNDNETIKYRLDSIYGGSPIKLSIFRSNYFLSENSDAESSVYYSNFITNDIAPSLEDFPLYTINSFTPSEDEVSSYIPDNESDVDEDPQLVKLPPRVRLEFRVNDYLGDFGLDSDDTDGNLIQENQSIVDYFQEEIINKAGDIEFSNPNNFKNFFRGIYFKAEKITDEGSLIFFDMSNARLTLNYISDTVQVQNDDDGTVTEEVVTGNKSFDFLFTSVIINSFDSNFSNINIDNPDDLSGPSIKLEDELEVQSTTKEAENLYLKGGEGSYAIIDLFNKCVEIDGNGDFVVDNNGNPIFVSCTGTNDKTELDFLKSRNWLINNASIKFYINQDQLGEGGITEPERLYMFNLNTGNVLIDYNADGTGGNSANPVSSVINHLERITRDSDDKGEFYKIVLTRHIINVLNGDTENVKLGLSISQNVNNRSTASAFSMDSSSEEDIIPFSSIISHEGTILYGNGSRGFVPDDKRLKLNILYTESKTNK